MEPAADDDGSARRRHHFGRRSRAAREGRHLSLAASLLREVVREQGLDPRWVVPLDGEERDALAAARSGGSLRRLRILVEHVVDLRTAVLQ